MQIEKPRGTGPTPLILTVLILGMALGAFFICFKSLPRYSADTDLKISQLELKQSDNGSSSGEVSQTKLVETLIPLENKDKLAVTPSQLKPSAVLTSFYGDVKVIGAAGERKAQKNLPILEGETIEVGASGEAVFEIEELYVLRLKTGTKVTQLPLVKSAENSTKKSTTYRLKLDQGVMLGTTKVRGDKTGLLELLIKDKSFSIQDSTFRAQLSDASPWLGVLRGSVKANVENASAANSLVIHALEKVSLSNEVLVQKNKISEHDWGLLRETYDMNAKTAVEEARQIDLSKRAGDFFQFVFDHGNFYTENFGYTVRDFFEDKESGGVYLEAEYDVFPDNSFVGLYVLTRDLDARNFGGIRFQIRRKPGEGYPERFYIEIKSKGQIVRRFEIADIKPLWEARQIDFFTPTSMPITELTLAFFNDKTGSSKKGYIQLQNIHMIPLTETQTKQRLEASTALPSATPNLKRITAKLTHPNNLTNPPQKYNSDDLSGVGSEKLLVDNRRKIADEIPKLISIDDIV